MARFTTRDEFKKYILRKLGAGVTQIQVTNDQLDDNIEDGIKKFQRYHFEGSGRAIVVLPKLANQTTFLLPETTLAVNQVMHGRYGFGLGGSGHNYGDNLLEYGAGSNLSGYNTYGNADGQVITPYYLQEQWHATMMDIMVPDPQYRYSNVTCTLELMSAIDYRNRYNEFNAIYLEIEMEYTEDAYPGMYDHEWLKEYCIALCGVQWGKNITRFTNVALPGSGISNGSEILKMYRGELSELETELEASGHPPGIYVM